ncbi:MAG: hypothetical protein ACR2PR_03165 [Pseudohongiellaceae bacterium]
MPKEKVPSVPINPDAVFASLDATRESGELADAIAEQSPIRYQASKLYPDMLERIDSTGKVSVGQYANGEFRPIPTK